MHTEFYDILGINHNCNDNDIKKAYRKKAMLHHPDKGGNEQDFKNITKAYEVLSNKEKREIYDKFGENGLENMNNGSGGIDPHDIFRQFFNGDDNGFSGFPGFNPFNGRQQSNNGNNGPKHTKYDMRLSLKDAYVGCLKKLQIKRLVMKKDENFKIFDCPGCDGAGGITEHVRMGFFTQVIQKQCPICNGKCKSWENGKLENKKEIINVNIEKGVPNNTTIELEGKADYDLKNEGLIV